MRIALLFEFGTMNGGEHSMLAVIDRLRTEVEFVAVAPREGRLAETLRQQDIEHVVFDVRDDAGTRKPAEVLIRELASVVGDIRPDLVHANSLSMSRWTGAMRVAGAVDVPCTGHLRDIVNLSAAAMRDINGNDRLVAVSRATAENHVARGLDANRVEVLHNGVDSERFQPRPATGSLGAELGVRDDAILALAVGQIGLRKGLDVLAEAFAQLRHERLHLILVGERLSTKAESIAFEQDLATTFERAGLGDRLHRLGFRDDIPQLMNEADLLIHAAKQEPLGRVLLEAAASGLPIVATNVGGTPEILDESSAILVPPKDATALSTAIDATVDGVDAARSRAVRARRVIEERFGIDRSAEAHFGFWNRVALDQVER